MSRSAVAVVLTTAGFSLLGTAASATAPPPDPEAGLELEFTVWAESNGVVFDRLSCDVTTGEGDVCFVLAGADVAAYIPAADGVNWTLYGADVGAAPVATLPLLATSATPTTTVPVTIQPLVSGTCDASYPDVCIPPAPPDLDCGDVSYRRFTVLPPDPHGFDGDQNGVGCEG